MHIGAIGVWIVRPAPRLWASLCVGLWLGFFFAYVWGVTGGCSGTVFVAVRFGRPRTAFFLPMVSFPPGRADPQVRWRYIWEAGRPWGPQRLVGSSVAARSNKVPPPHPNLFQQSRQRQPQSLEPPSSSHLPRTCARTCLSLTQVQATDGVPASRGWRRVLLDTDTQLRASRTATKGTTR